MRKLTFLLLVAFLVSPLYANQEDDLNAKRIAWSKAYLEKKGYPVPDSGIKVVPEIQMASYAEKKEERIKFKKEIQKLGYIKATNPSTNLLLTLPITSKRDLLSHSNDSDPQNTHLKRSLNDMEVAYTPTPIASVVDTYIGAAPYLTYLKGQGWVGVVQFFTQKNIGNCSFSENNVKLSHGAIIIAQEDVRNDINGKITTVEVMGTPESGFTYTVEWFDDLFFRTVECANMQYSADINNAVIELAKKIDIQ